MGETWEFPGGKVDGGESLEEALAREWQEELEVDVTLGEKLGEVPFSNGEKRYLLHAFIVRPAHENWVFHEHTDCLWATPEELRGLNMSDSDRRIIPFLEKY